MATRALLQNTIKLNIKTLHLRRFSTSPQQHQSALTAISVDPNTTIATLTLQRPPANALNAEMMNEVAERIKQIEKSKCRGLILTSASERIFCAGLDLKFVHQADEKGLTELWLSLRNMWQVLFSTTLPTVALINGHATAGGCMIATCCDYRVMLPNFIIGLNETKAGIAAPKFVMDSYENVVLGRRVVEADLVEGRVYDSDGALKIGLVDAVVESKQKAMDKCLEFLPDCSTHEQAAKGRTKLQFREQILKDFSKNKETAMVRFLENVQRKDVQDFLGEYLTELKKKKKQK